MFSRFILSICLVLIASCVGAHELHCVDLFTRRVLPELVRSPEEIEQTIQSLSALRLEIDLKHAQGNRSLYVNKLESDYAERVQDLIQFLKSKHLMTREELFAKIRATIQTIQEHEAQLRREHVEARDRQQSEVTAAVNNGKVIFHQIEPGSFEMGEEGKQVFTTISKPFDMAATQTTQFVWRRVVEAAKVRFPGEFDTLLRSDPSHYKGDLKPVEQVSYKDIQIWLTAANKLIDAGDPVIEEIMPGTSKGSHLRLPTEAEWEFVARARGAAMKDFYSSDEEEADLSKLAWYYANSDNTTHPVAEKVPLAINRKEFYDLLGNVWEIVSDWHYSLQGNVDPQGPAVGNFRVMRGGSWSEGAQYLNLSSRNGWGPIDRGSHVGFRLVRTPVP